MLKVVSSLLGLLLCGTVLGQSGTTGPDSRVHISGSVTQCGNAVPATLVRFAGATSETTKSDRTGTYKLDLPLGSWIATTPVSLHDAAENRSTSRPRRFRLDAPGNLVLDLYLRPPVVCDVMFYLPNGRAPTPEELSNRDKVCYGEEFFSAPSKNGEAFEVDLFGVDHDGDVCYREKAHRRSATYNLLTVEADQIVYRPAEKILRAQGNVVIDDETDRRTAPAVSFRIEDGRAVPTDTDHPR